LLAPARLLCFAIGASLAPGCVDHDCSLDHVVDEFVGTTAHVDCGHFQASANDDPPYRAAHDCVVAAYSQQQAFAVVWNIQGIEGQIRSGYAGVIRDGDYRLARFDQGFLKDTTVPPTIQRNCSAFLDDGACEGPHLELCLRCVFISQHTCEP
jgi:hypothetical protein